MLEVTSLTKSYGRRRVLDDVGFVASAGEVTGLLGPNGSGKSTTIHIVTGLLRPSSGTTSIGGAALNSREYRARIGLCPDDLPQPELLTGREYLELVQGIRRLEIPEEALALLIAGFRLDLALDSLIGTYSHGMKRKIQVVASVLHRPELLVLDEPFRGLDPESSEIIRALLTTYASQGRAVLISTHDLLLAERLCQRVIVLREGSVVADGSPAELTAIGGADSFEDSFLAVTGLDAVSGESSQLFLEGLALLAAGTVR